MINEEAELEPKGSEFIIAHNTISDHVPLIVKKGPREGSMLQETKEKREKPEKPPNWRAAWDLLEATDNIKNDEKIERNGTSANSDRRSDEGDVG